jgi:hypothetical protein
MPIQTVNRERNFQAVYYQCDEKRSTTLCGSSTPMKWVKRQDEWVKFRWWWLPTLASVASTPLHSMRVFAAGGVSELVCPASRTQACRKILKHIRFFLISDIGNGYANILDLLRTVQCPQPRKMPLPGHAVTSAERSRAMSADDIRRRALNRLYERRHAVEVLIRSLEGYEQCHKPCATASIDVIAARKCS